LSFHTYNQNDAGIERSMQVLFADFFLANSKLSQILDLNGRFITDLFDLLVNITKSALKTPLRGFMIV